MSQSKNRLYLLFGLLVMYLLLTVADCLRSRCNRYRVPPLPDDRQPQRCLDCCPAAPIVRLLHLGGSRCLRLSLSLSGLKTKDKRYDKMAQEFIKLCMGAFSTTALMGGVLVFILIWCYPKVMNKLSGIFGPSMIFYVILFFGETFTLYLYSYGWDRMQGKVSKMWHLFLGILLNVFGTAIMFVSNAWLTYQTSPALMGPKPDHKAIPLHNEETGEFIGTLWQANQ